jgi:hypothetical protein
MTYNSKNAKETNESSGLPADSILDGIITSIKDGQVKDFIKNPESWTGDIENPAIDLQIEVTVPGKEEKATMTQLYTYKVGEGNVTEYHVKSNLGKFKLKYTRLPEPGLGVKVTTNSDGFGKVKLD